MSGYPEQDYRSCRSLAIVALSMEGELDFANEEEAVKVSAVRKPLDPSMTCTAPFPGPSDSTHDPGVSHLDLQTTC